MLWSLAAVECQNRELTSALIVRANVETGSLAPLEIAMVSQALADLGACLEDHVNVDTLLQRAASIARDFTPRVVERHLRQQVRQCRHFDAPLDSKGALGGDNIVPRTREVFGQVGEEDIGNTQDRVAL